MDDYFMTIATPKTNPPAHLLKILPHIFRDAFTRHLLFINVLEELRVAIVNPDR